MMRWASAVVFGVVFGLAGVAQAGEVTVKGVHLCCGACVRDVTKALTGTEGVSDIAADRDAKTVTFTAADDKAAEAAIKALALGGFYGKATHGGKAVAFPDSGAKKGAKADKVVLRGVHACCGACVRDIRKTLADLPGAKEIQVDRNDNLVTITGDDIEQTKAVEALNAGGFFGKVESK